MYVTQIERERERKRPREKRERERRETLCFCEHVCKKQRTESGEERSK